MCMCSHCIGGQGKAEDEAIPFIKSFANEISAELEAGIGVTDKRRELVQQAEKYLYNTLAAYRARHWAESERRAGLR